MAAIIDTSVLIQIEREGHTGAESVEPPVGEGEPVAVAAVTISELLFGVYGTSSDRQRDRSQKFVNAVLDSVPVIPFDLAVAEIYARLWVAVRSRGGSIEAHDLQIGATALSMGDAVVSIDGDFERIPGPEVRRPAL